MQWEFACRLEMISLYFSQIGFSDDFLLTENTLVEHGKDGGLCRDKDGNVTLQCTCGLVISGKTDPTNPLFTPIGGSFWTNNSFSLLELPSGQDPRLHPRNRCMHEGYGSLALIPIFENQKIVGLLQLNNRKTDSLMLDTINFFELISANIGETLMRKKAEWALKERFKELNCLYGISALIELPDISSEELLKKITYLLPLGLAVSRNNTRLALRWRDRPSRRNTFGKRHGCRPTKLL